MASQFDVSQMNKLNNVNLPITQVAWSVGSKIASNVMGKSGLNELLGFPNEKDMETYLLKSYFDYNKGLGVTQETIYKKETIHIEERDFATTDFADNWEYDGWYESSTRMGGDEDNPFSEVKVDRTYKISRKIPKGTKLTALNKTQTTDNGIVLNFTPDWNDSQYVGYYYTNDFVRMFLLNRETGDVLCLPCLDGSPIITFPVNSNERPIASNSTPVTTSIEVRPKTYQFSFPISYLSVYGTNIEGESYRTAKRGWASATKKWLTKTENKIDSWTNKYLSKVGLGSGDDRDRLYKGEQVPRQMETIEQIYDKISRFHTQSGVYLFTGFDSRPIHCDCNIEMSFAKGDIDAVLCNIILKEIVSFDSSTMTIRISQHDVKPTNTKKK